MNNLPNINLNFQLPEAGFNWKVDLDFNLFLPALEKSFGIDLKTVVIPCLMKLVRTRISDLEKAQGLSCLSGEGEQELKNFQDQENNLALWLNEINHN
ncbi:MAG: hypothetical protein mread185_000054 [Mycoplasmataceae bacterium]|nr:MAG: hypothetical protein mread185_000054 [Mycoplasmataceae bacterium]